MAEFRPSGGRLVVNGDLDDQAEAEMRECCRELLAGGADPVTVDLSKVRRITSICIGVLVAFWIDLREAGRRLKVVPSREVMRSLDMIGLVDVLLRPSADEEPDEKPQDAGAEATGEDEDSELGGAKRAKF